MNSRVRPTLPACAAMGQTDRDRGFQGALSAEPDFYRTPAGIHERTGDADGRGFSGRTVIVLLVIALVGIVAAEGVAWATNVEPIRVDSSAIAIRPPTIVQRSVDAISPRGESFTQYTLGMRPATSSASCSTCTTQRPTPSR